MWKVTTPATGAVIQFEDQGIAEAECVRSVQLFGQSLLNDLSSGDRNALTLERRIVQAQAIPYVFVNASAGALVTPADPKSEVVGVDGNTYFASDSEVLNSLASMLAQGWSVANDGTIHPPVRE